MRKKLLILIVIMVFIVTGCSGKNITKYNYNYKGENNLWTAEYKVNGTSTFIEQGNKIYYDSDSKSTLIVTYKKDLSDLSSIKHLVISYESSAGNGNLNLKFDHYPPNKKTYMIESGGTGRALENTNEIIKVTINIDGKAQTIKLKNVQ
ncbi:hypothetical protein [Clostridium lundense]|uniref:hypothetical protein n=1 Tax=Clostridium lundense TaxID=319475 RepID=UPI0004857E15|nr:hypothetical protein [Clostridium lundense]